MDSINIFSEKGARDLLIFSIVCCNVTAVYFIRKLAAYHPQSFYKGCTTVPIPALARFLIADKVEVDFKMRGIFESCEVAAEYRDKMSDAASWLYSILFMIDFMFLCYGGDLRPYVDETVYIAAAAFLWQFWLMYYLHAFRNYNNASVFELKIPKNRILILNFITLNSLFYLYFGFTLWFYRDIFTR